MAGHWTEQYGSQKYRWQSRPQGGRTMYYRPLGFVERAFHLDGLYYEGRADISSHLVMEAKTTMTREQIRERILLAWTAVRCQHLLLQATAAHCSTFGLHEDSPVMDLAFRIALPDRVETALEDAHKHLIFLEDHYEYLDAEDFKLHCQNTARVIDPQSSLARLNIYPLEPHGYGKCTLRFLWTMSHEIADGLACFMWYRNFLQFINRSNADLRKSISQSLRHETVLKALPIPQEALYPPIPGSRARQRWFWLLTRILRHVRKPLPPGFSNPLRRPEGPLPRAIALSPVYTSTFDYTRTALLNALTLSFEAGNPSTQWLHRICRDANVSIGAGMFALVAIVMMEFHEKLRPDIPLHERRPFISGFPLNPRAFFNHNVDPNCLMLAFCDGIALPFLPSHLDFEGRLRLTARQAHRQLAVYQKRKARHIVPDERGLQYMGSRGAGRLLAMQYLSSLERMGTKKPRVEDSSRKAAVATGDRNVYDVQGAYPARPNATEQTCGVSSVGRMDGIIAPGMYDIDALFEEVDARDRQDGFFAADFRGMEASVRPREGEFLVSCSGTGDSLRVGASVDASANDPAQVTKWRSRLESILNSAAKMEKNKGEIARL